MTRRASLCILLLATALPAQTRLANVFGDGMVLQCNKTIRVFGFGKPQSKIGVTFAGRASFGVVDTNGRFVVEFPPMKPSAEGRDLVVRSPDGTQTIRDVLVGEVWVCGGQSNMAWSLRGARDADLEIPSANYPQIRFVRLPLIARPAPQRDLPKSDPRSREGNWRTCTPDQVENCTAVGYYFARRLHRRLRVPIGLLDASWGGTMAQHWVPMETLRTFATMTSYINDFAKKRRAWLDAGGEVGAKARLTKDIETWKVQRDSAAKAGKRPPRQPNPRAYEDPGNGRQPGGMWNGMIRPIADLTVRGVLFYQGENNSFGESWKPFPQTFPAVIASWRRAFRNPQLPFGIVQIAGWSNRRSMKYDMNHHTNIVREVQFDVWRRTPHTGLIVTFDTNSNGSIHPTRKQPVGERSARWALAEVYGVKVGNKPLEWRGPIYQSMAIAGDKVRITFEKSSARGLRLDQDIDVGFYVAGKDRVFHHARARVQNGSEVLVWSDAVNAPVAVRYASSNLPMGGLMNGRELPAYPFRTDAWPLEPHQSKGLYARDR